MEILSQIISAVIVGGLALVGVIITNSASNNRMQIENKAAQAVTDNKIENDFAERVPILEEKVKILERDVEDLKR